MAYIGVNYFLYATENGEKGEIAKPITIDISINVNNQKLYAGNAVRESDNSFISGTITAGIDDLGMDVYAALLGHEIDQDGEVDELICNVDDEAPYVQIGYYASKKVNGAKLFRAIWHPKVKFSEPNDTVSTKGESLTFQTGTITGEIMADEDGNWKIETTVESEEEAIAWLNDKAGIEEEVTPPEVTPPGGGQT